MEFISLLFKAILLSSAMGSFLVIILIIIKKLFKNKLSATWHYYIWLLLILRLAIPYSYQSPLSVFNLFTNNVSNIVVSSNITNIKNSEVIQKDISNNSVITNHSALPTVDSKAIKTNSLDLVNIVSIVWLFIGLNILCFIFIFNMIFNKCLGKQKNCKDEETLDILKACQAITKTKGYIPIVYSKSVSGVSLYGTFKPQILISCDISNNLTVEQKKYIFLHELIHLKYKDILLNSIMLILAILNWFNPIIWYAYYRMQQDCELACDEKVMSYLQPNCYNDYGNTIINIAEIFSKSHNLFNSTALVSNKSNLKRRISVIKAFKGKSFKWSIIGLTLILVISLVCLVNPKAQSNTVIKPESEVNSKAQNDTNTQLVASDTVTQPTPPIYTKAQVKMDPQPEVVPEVVINYQSIAEDLLKQKNLKVVVNSGAALHIKLPNDFNDVRDGFNIGKFLKQRNELSKKNNLDFTKYMGQVITLYTYDIYDIKSDEAKLDSDVPTREILFFMAESKVVGYWIADIANQDIKSDQDDFYLVAHYLRVYY